MEAGFVSSAHKCSFLSFVW